MSVFNQYSVAARALIGVSIGLGAFTILLCAIAIFIALSAAIIYCLAKRREARFNKSQDNVKFLNYYVREEDKIEKGQEYNNTKNTEESESKDSDVYFPAVLSYPNFCKIRGYKGINYSNGYDSATRDDSAMVDANLRKERGEDYNRMQAEFEDDAGDNFLY